MKKFTIQAILLLAAITFALYFYNPINSGSKVNLPFTPQQPVIKNLKINDKTLKVEIADTQDKRTKGLSGREKIASDEGILFIYPNLGKYQFWMKGLQFSLDFIWIKDNTIVDIIKNVQPPLLSEKDADLLIYVSKVEVNKILEVNGGTADRLDIRIGDNIDLEDIK